MHPATKPENDIPTPDPAEFHWHANKPVELRQCVNVFRLGHHRLELSVRCPMSLLPVQAPLDSGSCQDFLSCGYTGPRFVSDPTLAARASGNGRAKEHAPKTFE